MLRPAMRVLDLMASWDSHLPPALCLTVTGLGMNTVELERNPRLAERVVHDLNARPELPFVVSFSDRWFPPKAIRLWTGLHPFERLAFVADPLFLVTGYRAAPGKVSGGDTGAG